MNNPYDADYFLRGKETGKSLYTDYRWLPELTVPMVKAIAEHLQMRPPASVLDFGCARGYVVKALRSLGYDGIGVDISEWALENADLTAKPYLFTRDKLPISKVDYVVAKDVLEHVSPIELDDVVRFLFSTIRRGMLVVVPLSPRPGDPYVVPEYEQDVTHAVRWPLSHWFALFTRIADARWKVEGKYRLAGVKDNYYENHPYGNGFLTITEKT